MRLFFNELSARVTAASRHEGRVWMEGFVNAITSLSVHQPVELIAVKPSDKHWNFFTIELSKKYTLSDWLCDREVDRDIKAYFRIITTKTDIPDDIDDEVKDCFYLSEFLPSNRDYVNSCEDDACGLGLAYLLNTVAASLASEECWKTIRVPLRHIRLTPDGNEEEDVESLNISQSSQAKCISDILLERDQTILKKNPEDFINSKERCFPHLKFGMDINNQITSLPLNICANIISELIFINNAVRDWRRTSNQSEPILLNISGEGETTMQKFGTQRLFRDSKGNIKTFELHAKVGSQYRIHLRIDKQERSIEIGYIGKHLPTKNFPK